MKKERNVSSHPRYDSCHYLFKLISDVNDLIGTFHTKGILEIQNIHVKMLCSFYIQNCQFRNQRIKFHMAFLNPSSKM